MPSYIVINDPVLDHFLNDPLGEIGVQLTQRGRRMLLASKAQVGKNTGALAASISMRRYRDADSQYIWLGSENKIAYMHHQGTRPHVISPHMNHQFLRFRTHGQTVFSKRVMHPGTRPNHYLSDQLKLVLL